MTLYQLSKWLDDAVQTGQLTHKEAVAFLRKSVVPLKPK